jgi:hypothetical protein
MKNTLLILAAVVAGFIGGFVGAITARLPGPLQVPEVVRAHSFEVINATGEVSSYWGIDADRELVLAFGRTNSAETDKQTTASAKSISGPKNPDLQRAAIGLLANSAPFLKFGGNDSKPRMRLYLSEYDKPFFLLEDMTGPRIALGLEQSDTPSVEDDNWTLNFYPNRVDLGVITEKRAGQKYVRGFFSLRKDEVQLPQ